MTTIKRKMIITLENTFILIFKQFQIKKHNFKTDPQNTHKTNNQQHLWIRQYVIINNK